MTRILPVLHEGHAPVHLHEAFAEALEAFESWGFRTAEPTVRLYDRDVPISSIFGRMRTCFDILPLHMREALVDVVGDGAAPIMENHNPTYADAASLLRMLSVERLRDMAA